MTSNMISLPIIPPIFATVGALPSNDTNGAVAVVLTNPPTLYVFNGSSWSLVGGGGGGGSVSSVGLFDGSTVPLYAISGSPVTGAGTLEFTLNTQSANTVLAGPSSGAAAQPTFRALVAADIPALSYVTSVGLAAPSSVFSVSSSPVLGSGVLTLNFTTQAANTVFAGPTSGVNAVPTFRSLVAADIPSLSATYLVRANNLSDVANAATSFNNISPLTTTGDLIYEVSAGVAGRLGIGTVNQILTVIAGLPSWQTHATGTVTSVGLADGSTTPIYTIINSPVTSAGTLTFTLNSQTANTVFAAPNGSAGQPGFRALAQADLPVLTGYVLNPGGVVAATDTILQAFDKLGASALITTVNNTTYSTGNGAGASLIAGASNILIGHNSGTLLTSGSFNIAIGDQALPAAVTSNDNIAIGYQTLNANTGGDNIAIGYQALALNTTASFNVAIGTQSMVWNTTGANNTAVGYYALFGASGANGSFNTAFGYECLNVNTTGTLNAGSGYLALAANTTGSSNTGMGSNACRFNTTASFNTAVGFQALRSNSTGNNNVGVGYQAGGGVGGGGLVYTNNSYLGTQAGSAQTSGTDNTFLGYQAGNASTTGTQNISIGSTSNVGAAVTGAIAIGYGATATANGAVSLGAGVTNAIVNQIALGTSSQNILIVGTLQYNRSPVLGYVLTTDASGNATWQSPTGGAGTVTSVALLDGSTTPIYGISGSPITTAGTLTFTLSTQTANFVFAAPNGSMGQPTFRALVAADIPSLSATYLVRTNNLSDVASASTSFNNISPMTTTGDTIYEASAGVAARLAIGTTNQVLTVIAGLPSWQTPASTSVTLTGQVTGTGTGTIATTLATNTVTFAQFQQTPTLTIVGNNTGGTANASALTVAQVNAILPIFTSTLNGLAPLSGGGATNFLRADGTWAAPGGTGTVTSVALLDGSTTPIYGISGSPVTSAGTLTFTLSTQSSNIIFAGPASGVAAQPTFRALVIADIPSLSTLYLPLTGGTMSGAINMGSFNINALLDPTTAQQAATKNYVDTVASGLQPIQSVYAATIGTNIPGTYLNGAAGVGATFTTTATTTFTLDGTTPPLTSRILFKDQTSGFQNGVYSFTTAPVGGVSGAIFTRTLDYDTASDMDAGNLIPVVNGTVNALTSWLQTATVTTVGTDPLVFTQWTANPGNYLLKANNLSDVASASTSFNNISPMTTTGDIVYEASAGVAARLAIGSTNQVLTVISGLPSWQTLSGSTPAATYNSAGTITRENVWTSYTPTISAGFGTVTNNSAFWKILGDTFYVNGSFTIGTVAGSDGSVSLPTSPASFTINSAKLSHSSNTETQAGNIVGSYSSNVGGHYGLMVTAPGTSTSLVYFGNTAGTASQITPMAAMTSGFGSGELVSYEFAVPLT